MSATLSALRRPAAPLRTIKPVSVRYAAGKAEGGSDPRIDTIRQALYPSNIRNKPSPTGTWRPNVAQRLQRAIPSVQAHETIERAWFLHLRHIRRAREAELKRKFDSMQRAMTTLHEISPELWEAANKVEDPRVRSEKELETYKTLKGAARKAFDSRIRGLFPRELRIPTDTPPRDGWKYEVAALARPQ
ncbi:hypothetical protein C8Q75DRAFT_783784 [Abortiporus biennis]|nr:hypothetical protein C8Q75DRAFT_783784 [Abortiporus biennis]